MKKEDLIKKANKSDWEQWRLYNSVGKYLCEFNIKNK